MTKLHIPTEEDNNGGKHKPAGIRWKMDACRRENRVRGVDHQQQQHRNGPSMSVGPELGAKWVGGLLFGSGGKLENRGGGKQSDYCKVGRRGLLSVW